MLHGSQLHASERGLRGRPPAWRAWHAKVVLDCMLGLRRIFRSMSFEAILGSLWSWLQGYMLSSPRPPGRPPTRHLGILQRTLSLSWLRSRNGPRMLVQSGCPREKPCWHLGHTSLECETGWGAGVCLTMERKQLAFTTRLSRERSHRKHMSKNGFTSAMQTEGKSPALHGRPIRELARPPGPVQPAIRHPYTNDPATPGML